MSISQDLTRLQNNGSQHQMYAPAYSLKLQEELTNYHDIEVESLSHALSVPLVWQVGKANIASQFSAHNVPHVARGQSCRFWILRTDGLRCPLTHRIAPLYIRRCSFAIWNVWSR